MERATSQPAIDAAVPVHDLGGRAGELRQPARVPYDPDEPTFHHPWERDVYRMLLPVMAAIRTTPGEFRHALERLAPPDYFDHGYYGRWLAGLELLAVEHGLVDPGALRSPAVDRAAEAVTPTRDQLGSATPATTEPVARASARRDLRTTPKFAVGDRVTILEPPHHGHTRRARYTLGAVGTIVELHPPEVLPDASAHRLEEHPCWVYAVRFDARDLWGDDAEPNTSVTIDAYEPYLQPHEES